MQLGRYAIDERFEIPGGGIDALAADPESGKAVRLWVGSPLAPHAPDPLSKLVELKGRLARIYHATLPRVLDAEVVEGRPVLKLQPYRGRPLAASDPTAPRPVPEVLDLVRGVGAGLVKAHAAGVTHGAVSPEEIFLTEEGRPLLLHVGFGPFLERRPPRAPEDLEAPGAETADVFGLSRILALLLLGRDPFAGAETGEAFAQVGPRNPDEFPSELPEGLRRFLARALRPDLDGRIHRAEELAGDLGVIRASWESMAAAPAADGRSLPGRLRLRPLPILAGAGLLGLLILWRGCSGGS